MASLTREQAAILVWIVESGENTVVLGEGPGWATVIAGSQNLEVNASDVRELERLDLIRLARGHVYDLTNAGRAEYLRQTTPQPERPGVGFRPDAAT